MLASYKIYTGVVMFTATKQGVATIKTQPSLGHQFTTLGFETRRRRMARAVEGDRHDAYAASVGRYIAS